MYRFARTVNDGQLTLEINNVDVSSRASELTDTFLSCVFLLAAINTSTYALIIKYSK